MSQIIVVKLDVKKIDKERLFQGKESLYLDLVLIPTPNSKYDNYLVKQQADRGTDMPIIGGARYLKPKAEAVQNDEDPDALPF